MASLVEEAYGGGIERGLLESKPLPPTISTPTEEPGHGGGQRKPNITGTENPSELECGHQETMWSSIFTFAVLLA